VFEQFRKYHMNVLVGDISAKVGSGREDIFKATVGN
jgi:hypothetical protein